MIRRSLAVLFVAIMLVAGNLSSIALSESEQLNTLEYSTIFVVSKERIPDENSLLDQYLLDNFGMKMNWEIVPGSGYEEKLNLIFAAKQIPDFAWPVSIVSKLAKRYGSDGFLLPVDKYFDLLPNYRALYSDAEWEALLKTESNSDGHLYFLPQKNYRDTAMGWIYREDAFQKWELEVPNTLDELYETLVAIKTNDPASTPLGNQGGLSLLDGICLAHGIRRNTPFVRKDGAFVPYGQITDEYRESLKFAKRLYDEELVNKEFATLTEQQTTEMYANGKVYIHYYYPATRIPWAEEHMKALYPDAKWNYKRENITTSQDGTFYWEKESAFVSAGVIFTDALSEEKMVRLMRFYDWLATDEGALFITMGVEGKTFHYVDGEPQFMDHMYHYKRNPSGEKDWKHGLYLGNIVQHPAYLKEVGKLVDLEISKSLKENPLAFAYPTLAWTFSEDDERKLASLDVAIKDVTDEYSMKFIMGQADPNSDDDWNDFIDTLKKVGLQEATEIRTNHHLVIE